MGKKSDLSTGAMHARSPAYDSLKGIGILVIVWGHNTLLSSALPELRAFFYSFNVHLFFILSLLLSNRAFTKDLCLNRMVRYGVPYVFFVTLGWVMMFGVEGSDGLLDELSSLLSAFLFGTSFYAKEASQNQKGFRILRYFLKKGFLDGAVGFHFALMKGATLTTPAQERFTFIRFG